MKKINLCLMLLALYVGALAQHANIKVVLDVTSADEKVYNAAVRHALGMSEAYPDAQIEIVIYSNAINMVLKEKSTVAEQVATLTARENVTVAVCKQTMKRYKVDATQLIKGVIPVDDGIIEIVLKQNEGWAYIKEGT